MKNRVSMEVRWGVSCLVLCALFGSTGSAPLVSTDTEALDYLARFGYVPTTEPGSAQLIDKQSALKKYLKSFQYMAGLNQTGELDNDTIRMMNTPRCAVPDDVGMNAMRRRKRYATEGSKWKTTSLRYKFLGYTQRLPQATTRSVVQKAFGFWSAVTPLTFTENPAGTADINILYAAGAHGDATPFDGPGGVLAHAYFPSSGGAAHFDEAESWTDGTKSGTNLLEVTTHEFGHSLGLGHSNIQTAVMAPYYTGYKPNLQLTRDDILGIQYLYGAPRVAEVTTVSATTRPTTTLKQALTTRATQGTTTSSPLSAVCANAAVDAMVVVNGVTYAFQGSKYYVLLDLGMDVGYPRPISDLWPALSGGVDAALYYEPITQYDYFGNLVVVEPGHLYLFRGAQYWKFDNLNQPNGNNPQRIADGFPGIPDNIDAIFIWSGDNKIYAIKGNKYYRYSRGVGTDPGYPQSMSAWRGIPTPVSAGFQWTNRRTYFFSGQNYYRFNDITSNVDDDFPRPTNVWWFGCPATASLLAGPAVHEGERENSQFAEVQAAAGVNDAAGAAAVSGCVISAVVLCATSWRLAV